jgi:hypothetical protein
MDKKQLEDTIHCIESELLIHDSKFAGNPVHLNCRSRFLDVISSLRSSLVNELTHTTVSSHENELNFEPDGFGQIDFHPGSSIPYLDRKSKKSI